jgi:hypothetical protein
MRTLEPEVVANAAPVDDQARWRMCGGIGEQEQRQMGEAERVSAIGQWRIE